MQEEKPVTTSNGAVSWTKGLLPCTAVESVPRVIEGLKTSNFYYVSINFSL